MNFAPKKFESGNCCFSKCSLPKPSRGSNLTPVPFTLSGPKNERRPIDRGILNSEDQEIFDAELSAMMISGFAFENAFKAWYLREKGNLYENEKKVSFSNHNFTTWVAQNRIKLLGWEDEALEKAEYFCVAWGRYPAHNQRKKERAFETWGADDIEQLKNLIQRLLDGTVTYK